MQNNFPKIPLLVSILFFVFFCFAFVFFYKFVNNSSEKADMATLEWQREERRRDEIKQLDDSIRAITIERTELQKHFAKSSDVVPFLDTLEELASRVQVEADVSSVDILENNAGLTVGLSTTGDFEDLYKFFTLLENSPYALEFISVNINKVINASSENIRTVWEATISIKLLSFVE